jgi:hypothetical protein
MAEHPEDSTLLLRSIEQRRALIDGDQWFTDQGERLDFAAVLADAGLLDWVGSVIRYFRDPSRYTCAHAVWVSHRRPREGELGWDAFLLEVTAPL